MIFFFEKTDQLGGLLLVAKKTKHEILISFLIIKFIIMHPSSIG